MHFFPLHHLNVCFIHMVASLNRSDLVRVVYVFQYSTSLKCMHDVLTLLCKEDLPIMTGTLSQILFWSSTRYIVIVLEFSLNSNNLRKIFFLTCCSKKTLAYFHYRLLDHLSGLVHKANITNMLWVCLNEAVRNIGVKVTSIWMTEGLSFIWLILTAVLHIPCLKRAKDYWLTPMQHNPRWSLLHWSQNKVQHQDGFSLSWHTRLKLLV